MDIKEFERACQSRLEACKRAYVESLESDKGGQVEETHPIWDNAYVYADNPLNTASDLAGSFVKFSSYFYREVKPAIDMNSFVAVADVYEVQWIDWLHKQQDKRRKWLRYMKAAKWAYRKQYMNRGIAEVDFITLSALEEFGFEYTPDIPHGVACDNTVYYLIRIKMPNRQQFTFEEFE